MMRKYFWTILLFLVLIEVFSLLPLRMTSLQPTVKTYWTGAIHVPVPLSKLEQRLSRLSRAAKKAGLDFIVVANQDKVFSPDVATQRDGVDIYTEIEASTRAGHALLFYSHTQAAGFSVARLKDLAWKYYLGTDSVPGLFLAVAHPSSVFQPWEELDRFPDGVELINLRSLVERQAFGEPLSFLTTILASPFNPFLASLRLFEPYEREFRGWDAINTVSPGHFGIMATDDLSDWPFIEKLGIPIPPWETTLGIAANVIFPEEPLSNDFKTRRRQVYRALREGRSALLFQALHPYEGNDWVLRCGQKEYRSGDRFALREPGCEFVVHTPKTLPYPKRLVLRRDGQIVHEIEKARTVESLPVEQDGAYRLEVWVHPHTLFRLLLNKEVPYLFYNPLYVR